MKTNRLFKSITAAALALGLALTSVPSLDIRVGAECDGTNHDFSYGWEQTTAPTCTETGEETEKCECGATGTNTRTVNALGHDFITDKGVKTAASCTANEFRTYQCSRCEETEDREVENTKTEHSYTVKQGIATPASCAADATYTYKCANCTATMTKPEEGTKTNDHSYSITSTTAATCKAVGEKVETCSVCGDVKNSELPIDSNNHATPSNFTYTPKTATTHTKKYACCDAEAEDDVACTFDQNGNTECVCGNTNPHGAVSAWTGNGTTH